MSVSGSVSVLSLPRDIQLARRVQVQILPVVNRRRLTALLTQLLQQESRESSRTLVRPSFHCALHRRIGHHRMGLGVADVPRGHEIENRLVGFQRSVGDDRFKGVLGGSSRIESFTVQPRSTPRLHGKVLSGQHDSRWRSPQDVIQVPRTDDRDQETRTLASRKQDSPRRAVHSQ